VGYEVTGVDVVEAYDRAMDAAARLNKVDDVTERIWQLVEASDNAAAQFVRQAVQGRMRATGQAIPMRHSGIS
jgi:ATP-dependent DNA ligase